MLTKVERIMVSNVGNTLAESVQTGHKVLIAHNGQSEEGVDGHKHMDDESTMSTRPFVHQRLRKLLDGRRSAVVSLGSPSGHSSRQVCGHCGGLWQFIAPLRKISIYYIYFALKVTTVTHLARHKWIG